MKEKMTNIVEDLVIIEKSSPIKKIELFCKYEEELIETGNRILLALYAIDQVLSKHLNSAYTYYIQDDMSVYFLLEKTKMINEKKENFILSLILMDLSKLIYRFTCARKFSIPDESINQLRINSWGKHYLREKGVIEKNDTEYHNILDFFSYYFDLYKNLYIELGVLFKHISEKSVKRIMQINKELEIKILF